MSLRFKTVIGVALIECFLLALLISTVLTYQYDSAEQALIKRANTTATLFASTTKDAVLSHDLASLETISEELMDNPDLVYVRVVDQNGQVFAEKGDQSVLNIEFSNDYSLDDAIVDGTFDVSSEIDAGGFNYGRVEIGFDIATIDKVIAETRELSISIAVVEMLLVALFSYVLGTYLTKQLKALREGARQISAGNYRTTIQTTTRDEISEVAIAFNQMSSVLHDSQIARDKVEQQLIELNKELELRVEKRTREIKNKISELEIINQKLSDTQAKLVQSETLASVGQFAAGIAHEINNPVSYIKSNLSSLLNYIDTYQTLLEEYAKIKDSNTEKTDQIRKIENIEATEDIEFINADIKSLVMESITGTERVTSITQGLKQFFPDKEQPLTACDINTCIASALSEIADFDGEVSTDLGQIPSINGDSVKLTAAVSSIVRNALQAVDDNALITVSSNVENETISVSISDNGSGIEAENIDRIFDPFFTTRDVGQAIGLGLSVCYGIIKNHNGTIGVESEVGKGSTFTIKLPA